MKKMEVLSAFVLTILILVLGKNFLSTNVLFFRLLVGVGFGYVLNRAFMGFAGSVNRAYRTGSTKLMRALMLMFFVTAIMMTGLLLLGNNGDFSLWIRPINFGLLIGGFLFGFGMSISSCCASGVLTDLAAIQPRAAITLLFFGVGVFFGFPIQKTASWVKKSWFVSSEGQKGVYLPDWFKWDGLNGYLGALILFAVFCFIVVYLSYKYEQKRVNHNDFLGVDSEIIQEKQDSFEVKNFKLWSKETYYKIFAKPWTMATGAMLIAMIFIVLTAVTKAGWGASTPYGHWFGRVLMLFGVSSQSLAEFTHVGVKAFEMPFFSHPVYVQNFGIFLGAVLYLLFAQSFKDTFVEALRVNWKEVLTFALGGFSMGFGTRLSNGCNVGALYTPIANFSLSGWIFLIFMVIGGIVSSKIFIKRNCVLKK